MEDQPRLRCTKCAERVVAFKSKSTGRTRYHHDYESIGAKMRLMRPEDVMDPLRFTYTLVCDSPVLSRVTTGTYDGRGVAKFNREKRRNIFKAINAAMVLYFFDELANDPTAGWATIKYQR